MSKPNEQPPSDAVAKLHAEAAAAYGTEDERKERAVAAADGLAWARVEGNEGGGTHTGEQA